MVRWHSCFDVLDNVVSAWFSLTFSVPETREHFDAASTRLNVFTVQLNSLKSHCKKSFFSSMVKNPSMLSVVEEFQPAHYIKWMQPLLPCFIETTDSVQFAIGHLTLSHLWSICFIAEVAWNKVRLFCVQQIKKKKNELLDKMHRENPLSCLFWQEGNIRRSQHGAEETAKASLPTAGCSGTTPAPAVCWKVKTHQPLRALRWTVAKLSGPPPPLWD